MAAVAEIRVLRSLVVQVAQMAEAQIMERLWRCRAEFGDDEPSFTSFVRAELDIAPTEALGYVATWETARKSRRLREMAQSQPDAAMAFVQRLVASGAEAAVVADDAEVTRLLTLPPRQQARALRDLIDTQTAVEGDRHPDDVRRIDELETELAVATGEVSSIEHSPAARARALTDYLDDVYRELSARTGDIDALGQVGQGVRGRAARTADGLIGLLERAVGATLDADTPDP